MVLTDLEITQASIELVSGFVSAMLAVIIIINGQKNRSMTLLVRMFFTTAAIFVTESMAYIFRGNTGSFSLFMTRFSNLAVFSGNCLLSILTTHYIYAVLRQRHVEANRKYLRIVYGCTIAAGVILLVNLFTGWMYHFDSSNYYHRSWGWYVYTLLSLVSLLTNCVLLICYRRYLRRATLASLLLFILFPIIAIVIQSMFYGLSITNLGIGISLILILVAYLIDWNRSGPETNEVTQVRRSYETILLFVIMVISISASIISCIVSIRRIAADMSASTSQVVAQIVHDHIDNVFLRPITVAETMSKDNILQDYMRRSAAEDPKLVEDEMADYLEAIRNGFGYQMVYAVNDVSKAYYTYDGIIKTVDPGNDPADLWYQNHLDSGMHCQLQVDTDEANNWDLSVFVNTDVLDTDGTLLGVCGIGLEMKELLTEIARFEDQYSVKITLADSTGLIQIDTDSRKIEQEMLPGTLPDKHDTDRFLYESLNGTSRLTKFMDNLNWYIVIEDLSPNKVDISQILLPNIVIFFVGLFMLAIAFCVIMIRERKIAEELVEKRITSLYDELTGLKNRRAFEADCAAIIESDSLPEVSVIMVDLNGLKETNDTLGHQAGDELIIAAAECLSIAFDKLGRVYRTGGDEYVALLQCSAAELNRALSEFDQRSRDWRGTAIHTISTAKGVASAADHPDKSLKELIELADMRMYEDKNDYYRRNGIERRHYTFSKL